MPKHGPYGVFAGLRLGGEQHLFWQDGDVWGLCEEAIHDGGVYCGGEELSVGICLADRKMCFFQVCCDGVFEGEGEGLEALSFGADGQAEAMQADMLCGHDMMFGDVWVEGQGGYVLCAGHRCGWLRHVL